MITLSIDNAGSRSAQNYTHLYHRKISKIAQQAIVSGQYMSAILQKHLWIERKGSWPAENNYQLTQVNPEK